MKGSGYSSGGNKKIKTIIKKKPRASPKKHALPDNKLSFQVLTHQLDVFVLNDGNRKQR